MQAQLPDLPCGGDVINAVDMTVIAATNPIAVQKIKDLTAFKPVPHRRKMKKNQNFLVGMLTHAKCHSCVQAQFQAHHLSVDDLCVIDLANGLLLPLL